MMKKLQAEEKEEQQNPERKAENRTEVFYAHKQITFQKPIRLLTITRSYLLLNHGTPIDRSYPIFHPPALV